MGGKRPDPYIAKIGAAEPDVRSWLRVDREETGRLWTIGSESGRSTNVMKKNSNFDAGHNSEAHGGLAKITKARG